MSGAGIAVERHGPVQIIRLARPEKRNAITGAMYQALADALTRGDDDPAVAVHVLLGSPGVFCAGNDLNDFLEAAKGASGPGEAAFRFVRLLPRIAKPVLAGVDGEAIGIGTTMLLHCDYVIATPASRFATPFVDLGLVPEAASSLLMPRLMGHTRAFAMLVLGEPLDADQARGAGLINHIVDAADLDVTILAAAKRLASKPQEAVRIARRLLRGDQSDVASRIEQEAEAFAARLASPEANEAIEAFFRTTAVRNRSGS